MTDWRRTGRTCEVVRISNLFIKFNAFIYQNIVEFDARECVRSRVQFHHHRSHRSHKNVVFCFKHVSFLLCTESIIVIMVFVSVLFSAKVSLRRLSIQLLQMSEMWCSRSWSTAHDSSRAHFSRHKNAKHRIQIEKLFFRLQTKSMTDQTLNKIISIFEKRNFNASTYQLHIWLIRSKSNRAWAVPVE